MAGQPWTDEEREILRKLAGRGKTAKEIARVLVSRSEDAIKAQAGGMCVSLAGNPPEIDMAEFTRLMEA
jgi:hypothetical protein